MLTHKRESCEAYRHVSIRRALTEELFTDPVFRSMCFNRFKIYLLYFSFVCLFFFLMDTNSRLYFQSVQFNGTGVVSGLLASPCCPVWYGRFILFYIGL